MRSVYEETEERKGDGKPVVSGNEIWFRSYLDHLRLHSPNVKPFRKGLPYYPPLTEPTMKKLFSALFRPFSLGQSSTFLVERGFGGGRALVRFLLLSVDDYARKCMLGVSSSTHEYVYIEPELLPIESSEAYEQLVYAAVSKAVCGCTHAPLSDCESIQKLILRFIEKKEVVLVFAGMSFLPYADRLLWARLRQLQVYPERVHFLFVLHEGGPVSFDNRRFSRLPDLINQNVVRFNQLSSKDIEYSIDRWAYTLGCDFKKKEREGIRASSFGRPALLKACCLNVAARKASGTKSTKGTIPYLHPFRQAETLFLKDNFELSGETSGNLSVRERVVLQALLRAQGRTVGRDKIASLVWGIDGQNFSDGAISQLMSRLRNNLNKSKKMKTQIQSVYRQGYRLRRDE